MAVLFATLGFTAKLALAPLRDHPEVDAIHLFYGTPEKPESKAAFKAAKATAETLGIKFVGHKIKGAFDYEAILEAFTKAKDSVKGEILMNASGGTRVMTMASTIFAFTHDLPMLYYDEYETTEGKEIPLKAFRSLKELGKSQLAILDKLRRRPKDMGALAKEVGLAPSTLSVHVHKMEMAGIVSIDKDGRRRVVPANPSVMSVGGLAK